MKASCGIYLITHRASGRAYVGCSVDLFSRWAVHRRDLRGNRHHSERLQRAWIKYGAQAFEFKILLFCDEMNLLWYEQRCLDAWPCFYNISRLAGKLWWTPELRARQGLKLQGRKLSIETRAKMSLAHKGHSYIKGWRKLKPDKVEEAKQLFSGGLPVAEIARRLGVHKSTVAQYGLTPGKGQYNRRNSPAAMAGLAVSRAARGRA